MVDEYRDARDARDAARESERFAQHEPAEFAGAWPVLTFKEWLIGRRQT